MGLKERCKRDCLAGRHHSHAAGGSQSLSDQCNFQVLVVSSSPSSSLSPPPPHAFILITVTSPTLHLTHVAGPPLKSTPTAKTLPQSNATGSPPINNQPETPSKTTKQTQSPHSLTELKWPLSRLVSTSSTTRACNLLAASAACAAFAHFECKSALVDGIWSQCKYSPVGCFLRIKCIFVYQHAPQGEGGEREE